MIRTIDFTVDLDMPMQVRQVSHVMISAHDLRERIRVLVKQGNQPVSLDGQTINATCMLASGMTVASGFEPECEVDGTGYAAVYLPKECYDVPGAAVITITATDSANHPLVLLTVQARVVKTTSGSVIDPESVIPNLQELQTIAATAADAVIAAEAAVDTVEGYDSRLIAVEGVNVTQSEQIGTLSGQIETQAGQIGTLSAQLDSKANVTGTYDDLTAGSASQLLSTTGVTDKAPYTLRTTGGGVTAGDRAEETIVGGSVCWNQQAQHTKVTFTAGGLTYTNNGDGSWTITGTSTSTSRQNLSNVSLPAGHVGLLLPNPSDTAMYGDGGIKVCIIHGSDVSSRYFAPSGGGLTKLTSYARSSLSVVPTNGFDAGTGLTITPQLFDLTAMFGSAVADAVYAMNQATAGSGVAWFRAMFPESYYPYNAGELMSVQTSGKRVTGFNQWNEDWELGGINTNGNDYNSSSMIRSKGYTPIIPGKTYCFTAPQTLGLRFYDSNKTFVLSTAISTSGSTYTAPSNAAYLRFNCLNTTTYNHDICINLSDPSKNGTYEPYAGHLYPLDSSLILRGIPKWDSVKGTMYYDGDEYTSDGRVTRRYGIVDLGDQTWYAVDGREGGFRFPPQIAAKKAINATTPANVLCPKYVTSGTGSAVMTSGNIGIDATWGYVYLMDSAFASYTVDQVKAALSGVYLVYELATPATDPADPYTGIQWGEAGGTEAFIDAGTETGRVAVPVGHDTFYPTDLRGSLETLLSPEVTVTGTTATITAERDRRYLCGTMNALTFTPCASGLCEVRFTSGTIPTALTLPQTVKMPDWWNGVEANYTYEISIADGVYGAVMAWAT